MSTTKIIPALIATVIGTLLNASVFADEPAVSEVNVEFGAGQFWRDSKTGAPDLGILSGSLSIQAPLGERVGMNVVGARAHGDYADNSSDYYYTDLRASLFLRRPEIGHVAIGFGNTRARIADMDTDGDYYNLSLAAYFANFTVSTGATEYDRPNAPNDSSGIVAAIWYPEANIAVSAQTGILDAKESYGVSMEQQFGQGGFAYGLSYGSNFDRDYDRYSLDLIYRLARPKSLIDRHRKDL